MLQRYFEAANRFIDEHKFSGIAVALVFYLLAAAFCFTRAYEMFELKLYDLRFALRPSIKEWDRLYFLDIDENSLTTVGQYPWPRGTYARGLETLRGVGAFQASFDIMFPDSSPRIVNQDEFNSLYRKAAGGQRIAPGEIEAAGIDNDMLFARGVGDAGNVIMAYTFSDEPLAYDVIERQKSPAFIKARERFLRRSSIPVPPEKKKSLVSLDDRSVKSISYPIPELMNAGHVFGFVNRYTDIDGVTRKVQLVQVYDGRIWFNLALVMLIDACGVSLDNVEVIPGRSIIIKDAINPLTMKRQNISIPIDRDGMMYVTWAGSGQGKGGIREKTFHLVPFYAVIEYPGKRDLAHEYFADEDRIKLDTLADLRERLEDFTAELHHAQGEMKKTITAGIAELKEKIEKAEKNPVLEDLEPKLAEAREDLRAAKDASQKAAAWQRIKELKKQIQGTRHEYLGNYREEVAKAEEELKAGDNAELRSTIDKLRYVADTLELVIRVEEMADSLALVGLTATGTQDIGAIPLHNEYARVGTYHNTINTIIQRQFIKRINWPLNLVIMLLVALAMGYTIQRLNAKRSLITMVSTLVALNFIVMAAFALFNLWFQQLGIVLASFLPSLAIVAIKFMKEESQKKFIKSAFSYYLAPSVIDEIIKDPESLELGGEDREITIFFSDIASFSTISEKLTPQDLVRRLNEYLTEMTDIILRYSGTVDKFIGDAIMAFYGAPIAMQDHQLKACMAAIEMKKRLRELQEEWRNRGMEPLFARAGIHSGRATVGNMGSSTRMDYTAMGDAVNLASRLEGANKYYSTHAMISGATYEGARDYVEVRKLDMIRVVGKTEAVPIYELLGKKGELPDRVYEMLEKYNQAMDHFSGRDWKGARQLFRQALKVLSDDGPSEMYVKRCETFIKSPPSKGWDGVFAMKGK
ncbi:MAG: CHASE2 domain-containing protein [Spirochaetes bacterium]|nr:CHASE2 domain-containing protein [Spirochaetota bacterium]